MSVIPIFTSHYSRKSILTFDTVADAVKHNKTSIFNICKENNILNPFVVENTMTGYMEMYKNGEKEGISPRFGLRRNFCPDLTETSQENTHKVVVFVKNTQGYKDLIKLHNRSNLDYQGFFTRECFDEYWTGNLSLVIPFYDSFLFENVLNAKACIPDFGQEYIHFIEDNRLPFDSLISNRISDGVKVQSIFYNKKAEFTTALTYKCSLNLSNKGKHRSISNPMFDDYHSDTFSFESFTERYGE